MTRSAPPNINNFQFIWKDIAYIICNTYEFENKRQIYYNKYYNIFTKLIVDNLLL